MPVAVDPPVTEQLETFANPNPGRDYTIEINCPEFTSRLPDHRPAGFWHDYLLVRPGSNLCVELKSLKLYLQRFRNQGIFYEAVDQPVARRLCLREPSRARCTVTARLRRAAAFSSTVTCTYPRASPDEPMPTAVIVHCPHLHGTGNSLVRRRHHAGFYDPHKLGTPLVGKDGPPCPALGVVSGST